MIELTNLAQQKIWVNQDLLKMIESTPDTILCFLDGSRLPVRETPQQVQQKIIEFIQKTQSASRKD